MNKKAADILKALFAAGLFIAIILNYKTLSNLDIRELISGAGSMATAAGIVLGVYFLKSLVFVVPASLIYISVGMAFSPVAAIAINFIGIMIEITSTYIMGRILGKDAVEKKLSGNKAGQKLLNMKSKSRNLMIFTIRFTGIPIDFSSLFMGAFDFKFIPYFFLSLLGLLPRVGLLTVIGDGFYDLIPMKYIITAVAVIIPVAVIIMIIKNIRAKKKHENVKKHLQNR